MHQKPGRTEKNIQTKNKGHITVPYEEGLSETIKNIAKKYGIEVHFRSGKTLKDELVGPKDKDHITNKVAKYTGLNVIGWSVMKNILVRQLEHLERG